MKVGEIMGRVIRKNGDGRRGNNENESENEKARSRSLLEIIREWFIRRGWMLSESGRAAHRYMPVYGIKDEPITVKVFVNLSDGKPWGRYYGPDIREEELKKLRK